MGVLLTHAAVQGVEHECKRWPVVHDFLKAPGTIRIGLNRDFIALINWMLHTKAVCKSGFERINHERIMRPCFREILPGMRGRIATNKIYRPSFARTNIYSAHATRRRNRAARRQKAPEMRRACFGPARALSNNSDRSHAGSAPKACDTAP